MKSKMAVLACALAVCACATYDGRALQPGQATEADVLRVMGQPSDTVARADGGKTLFYSRQPEGRATYAAAIAPNGSLVSVRQVLEPQTVRRVVAGISDREVRELLGPPARTGRTPFKPFDVWEYRWQFGEDRRVLWVAFANGVAQEVTEMHDYDWEPSTGKSP